jgi:ABC-type amino acid transport substrate-binding protein
MMWLIWFSCGLLAGAIAGEVNIHIYQRTLSRIGEQGGWEKLNNKWYWINKIKGAK